MGWNPDAEVYVGLVGGDRWSIELNRAEFDDFCGFTVQLAATMQQMAAELMDEEKISCEMESDRLWLEAEGYPHAYSLHLIVLTGRQAEGEWSATAVPELTRAVQTINVFF